MLLLENINKLEQELLELLEDLYYRKSPSNYVSVDFIKCIYDNDCPDSNGDLAYIEINIHWGRYSETDEDKKLNEDHISSLTVEFKYINNYDFIKGIFAEKLQSNNFD